MKRLFLSLILIAALIGCTKEQSPVPSNPITPATAYALHIGTSGALVSVQVSGQQTAVVSVDSYEIVRLQMNMGQRVTVTNMKQIATAVNFYRNDVSDSVSSFINIGDQIIFTAK